ncbi:hypothetical protein JB92DRAFT_2959951, partial [Gautieria morchelliformis]
GGSVDTTSLGFQRSWTDYLNYEPLFSLPCVISSYLACQHEPKITMTIRIARLYFLIVISGSCSLLGRLHVFSPPPFTYLISSTTPRVLSTQARLDSYVPGHRSWHGLALISKECSCGPRSGVGIGARAPLRMSMILVMYFDVCSDRSLRGTSPIQPP